MILNKGNDCTEIKTFLGIRVVLRGKAHVQWTIMRGGEARIAQQDQYFIDEKRIIWGKGNGGRFYCSCSQHEIMIEL